MEIGLETIFVIIIFLLPGFIATYIRLSIIPEPPEKKSALQEILGSLVASLPILLIQIAVLIILTLIFKSLKGEAHFILTNGFYQYISRYPTRSAIVILIWGFIVLIISIAYGYLDPIARIAALNRERSGIFSLDPLHQTFVHLPNLSGYERCYVRAWLKSGECYAGWMENFSKLKEDRETFQFTLTHVIRWRKDIDAEKERYGKQVQSVLLNSEDVKSIDMWYGHGPLHARN